MKVLVFWIRGHVGFLIVGVHVFELFKGMAEAGGVFGLQLDEAVEAIMLPMLVEALEEVNDGMKDAFDIDVGRSTHHRLEGVGNGGEGVGDLIRG